MKPKNFNLPLVAGCSVAYKLTFCVLTNGTSVWFYHADVCSSVHFSFKLGFNEFFDYIKLGFMSLFES